MSSVTKSIISSVYKLLWFLGDFFDYWGCLKPYWVKQGRIPNGNKLVDNKEKGEYVYKCPYASETMSYYIV